MEIMKKKIKMMKINKLINPKYRKMRKVNSLNKILQIKYTPKLNIILKNKHKKNLRKNLN